MQYMLDGPFSDVLRPACGPVHFRPIEPGIELHREVSFPAPVRTRVIRPQTERGRLLRTTAFIRPALAQAGMSHTVRLGQNRLPSLMLAARRSTKCSRKSQSGHVQGRKRDQSARIRGSPPGAGVFPVQAKGNSSISLHHGHNSPGAKLRPHRLANHGQGAVVMTQRDERDPFVLSDRVVDLQGVRLGQRTRRVATTAEKQIQTKAVERAERHCSHQNCAGKDISAFSVMAVPLPCPSPTTVRVGAGARPVGTAQSASPSGSFCEAAYVTSQAPP